MSDASRMGKLRASLRDGLGSAGVDVRAELGLAETAEDRDVARALVQILAAVEVASLGTSKERRHDDRAVVQQRAVGGADSSFLGRLGDSVSDEMAVGQLDDPRTLVAVLRGGTLRQRRAALLRLAERLSDGSRMPSDQAKAASEALHQIRDVELAYERALARERLPGAAGRKARAETEEWKKLVATVEERLAEFWDGELHVEPVGGLPGDQRALFLMRVCDLPDAVVAHLSAVVEGTDGVADREDRIAMLASLRHSADRRLVASLGLALVDPSRDVVTEAARVLGRIDDPRAHPLLVAAYEASLVDRQRAVVAGALATLGDHRGVEYLRGLLDRDDAPVLVEALESLAHGGAVEDQDAVMALLAHDDAEVVAQAVRTLGRIADGRVLGRLTSLRQSTRVSALWAEIEDAEAAIAARMELRGELPQDEAPAELVVTSKNAVVVDGKVRAAVRFRGWKDYVFGHLWLVFGGLQRAVARFEAAAKRRAGWLPPLVAIGMAFASKDSHALALAAFRRAIDTDRVRVERNPLVVRALARCFLRRAEEMERDGRTDIARGLVGEVLSLDLRRAPSALRFELERRHDALRRRAA